jgi:hypothetical protein
MRVLLKYVEMLVDFDLVSNLGFTLNHRVFFVIVVSAIITVVHSPYPVHRCIFAPFYVGKTTKVSKDVEPPSLALRVFACQ